MKSVLPLSRLLAVAVCLAAAPASAASVTVFWDRADFGSGAGIGVSQTTAQNAAAAGIPLLSFSGLVSKPDTLVVDHTLNEPSLVLPPGGPATINASWSATNNTGINEPTDPPPPQNLYLVYAQPIANTINVDGQDHDVLYDPADVGLTLSFGAGGLDWVIIQAPIASSADSVYFPAVFLGPLANGAPPAAFTLFYTLHNPQVFPGTFNDELGLPKWSLAFASNTVPIPEPSSGLLTFIGLLGIARARRKHA